MLTVFRCSTSYTVIIVLRKMLAETVSAPGRWWPCECLKCVSGLRRLEKHWSFWNEYMSLNWCSNMLQTKMKETVYSFSFTSLYWWVMLPPLLEWVFFSCVSCFRLKFSRIALWLKRLQLDSKCDLTTNGLILGFFIRKWLPPLTSYLFGLKSAKISQFLLLLTSSIFSLFMLRGILVLFFKNAFTF